MKKALVPRFDPNNVEFLNEYSHGGKYFEEASWLPFCDKF